MTIEDQLRDTFAAHESLADAARAQQIARTAPRRARRWPVLVAAAAVVVLVAGSAAYLAVSSEHQTAVAPRPPSTSAPVVATLGGNLSALSASDALNRVLARHEATRLLQALPLPRGAVELSASPTAALNSVYVGTSTSDSRLSRRAWWMIPVTDAQFTAWLSRHQPAGAQVDEMGVDSSHANYAGKEVHTTIYHGPATTAWGPTTVIVTHVEHRGGTAVRIDVDIAVRFARTESTLAGDQVTSITISRTVTGTGVVPGRAPLQDRSLTLTGTSAIATLAADFDRLRGALDTPGIVTGGLLPPVSDPQVGTYRVTFRSPGSWLTVTWQHPDYSGIPVATLWRDGHQLRTTLDLGTAGQLGADGSGDSFRSAVERALGP